MLLLSPIMKVNKDGWGQKVSKDTETTIKYKCYAIGLFHAFRSNSFFFFFLVITFKAQQPQSSSLWGKIQNLRICSPSYIILDKTLLTNFPLLVKNYTYCNFLEFKCSILIKKIK